MDVRRLASSDADLLDPLIHAYPFKPYRNYRLCSRRRQDLALRTEIQATLERSTGHVLLVSGHGSAAAIVFRRLDWDSDFFGIEMGRVDYILHSNDVEPEVLSAALDACFDNCRTAGLQHLSTRVDVADVFLVEALERHGFSLKESLVSFLHHQTSEPAPMVREMGKLRPFEPSDTDEVVDIAREAYTGFRGRFSMDRHISRERADAMYVEWARRCCSGEMAQILFVTANARGGLSGFCALRRLEPISSVGGVPLFGGGLGGCRKDSPGTFNGLVRACMQEARDRGGAPEAQTQNHNYTSVRLYAGLGMDYVRADYTFHAWLGD